jgi:hypothetical protein
LSGGLFLRRLGQQDAALHGVGEVGPAALPFEELVERAVRVHLGVAVLRQDRLVRLDGVRGVGQLVHEQRSARVGHLAARLGVRLELHAPVVDAQHVAEAAGLPVELGQRGDGAFVIGHLVVDDAVLARWRRRCGPPE